MKKSYLKSKTYVIEKTGLTIDVFKEKLKGICPDDFNGNSGEEYFVEVIDSNGAEILKSEFDAIWDSLIDLNTDIIKDASNIANEILKEAYSCDREFDFMYELSIVDTSCSLIIFVASANIF